MKIELKDMRNGMCYLLFICDEPRRPRRGAPRRIIVGKYICKHRTAPPCPGEALRRGILLKLHGLMIFMVFGANTLFMPVFPEQIFPGIFIPATE